MKLWLVVPIKSLSQGKSRLAPSLSAAGRRQLSQDLLQKTLAEVRGVDELAGVIVISRDAEALSLAQAAGVVALAEVEPPPPCPGNSVQAVDPEFYLNAALDQARQTAVHHGADAILILPADLPLLSSAEIRILIQQAKEQSEGLVISPSRDGGTNALLLQPPDVIDFAFGPNSFRHHIEQAGRRRLSVRIVESTILALDLDRPEDLMHWQTLQQG